MQQVPPYFNAPMYTPLPLQMEEMRGAIRALETRLANLEGRVVVAPAPAPAAAPAPDFTKALDDLKRSFEKSIAAFKEGLTLAPAAPAAAQAFRLPIQAPAQAPVQAEQKRRTEVPLRDKKAKPEPDDDDASTYVEGEGEGEAEMPDARVGGKYIELRFSDRTRKLPIADMRNFFEKVPESCVEYDVWGLSFGKHMKRRAVRCTVDMPDGRKVEVYVGGFGMNFQKGPLFVALASNLKFVEIPENKPLSDTVQELLA